MEKMKPLIANSEPLDARQLRALCVLGMTGSFTETARRLHLTQSAISHSMKALETEMGMPLIERSGRKALLTQAGQTLVARAERILTEMGKARGELQHLARWGGSRLRLGASSTACQYLLPAVIREFRRQFQHWQIEVSSRDTLSSLDDVKEGIIDLALCMDAPGTERDLEFRPLFSEEIKVAVPAGHRWEKQKSIAAAELVKEPLLSYTASSYLSQIIRTHIEREGLRMPPPAIELGSLEAIKEMVILGMGVALMPAWVASSEVAAGTIVMVPLTGKKLSRRWGIAYRRGRRLSHGEETFVKLCTSNGLEMTGVKAA
jgi:DNA-binding transcriptional LysR family regulator